MFQTFVTTTAKLLAALPAVLGFTWTIHQAAENIKFINRYPTTQPKLSYALDLVIYVAVEHWILYIIVCCGLGLLWTLVVGEPKKAAEVEFSRKREKIRGKK